MFCKFFSKSAWHQMKIREKVKEKNKFFCVIGELWECHSVMEFVVSLIISPPVSDSFHSGLIFCCGLFFY